VLRQHYTKREKKISHLRISSSERSLSRKRGENAGERGDVKASIFHFYKNASRAEVFQERSAVATVFQDRGKRKEKEAESGIFVFFRGGGGQEKNGRDAKALVWGG